MPILDLDRVAELASRESGLAVVITLRDDGSPHTSVVNAGVLEHPITKERVVGFAVRGRRRKLENLRARPRATVVFRSGWDWIAVEGATELIGPDDPIHGLSAADVQGLLRAIYAAAVGGDPEGWAGMDESIRDERHTAVLVHAKRTYSNPSA